MIDPDEDWQPPPSFEEYRVVRRLGRGAMGEVYLCDDVLLDRQVAVKFVREPAGTSAAARMASLPCQRSPTPPRGRRGPLAPASRRREISSLLAAASSASINPRARSASSSSSWSR